MEGERADESPELTPRGPAFEAMSDAVLAIASERAVAPILQRLVHAARDLVGARYAALGVPDEEGGFAEFLTSGMSDALITAIGPLPRSHGMLDAMLQQPEPYRIPDIQQDPRFRGWPPNHPHMRSFMGVPIVSKGTVIGAFYLTDKRGAGEFTAADQELIEVLAAHAAVAIENARLYERSRELSVVEERNRLARDLHDSVTQTLFSLSLTADATATLLDRDPDEAHRQLERIRELARSALEEMRALVFELRPADVGADGLVATLRKHVAVLRRVHDAPVELAVAGERRLEPETERELFRIVQEAMNNALKHAGGPVQVSVEMSEKGVCVNVCDEGCGFDPDAVPVRAKHLGLTSMEERARELGAELVIDSAPGRGTVVSVEITDD